MRKLGIAFVFAATIILVACGKDPKTDVTGSWKATLTSTATPTGGTPLVFTDTLTTGANTSTDPAFTTSSVTAASLIITTNNGCLTNAASQTGTLAYSATSNTFILQIYGPGSAGNDTNALILQGTLDNDTITGTWSLSNTVPPGSGISTCNDVGTFTMTLISGSNGLRHGG